VAAFWLYALIFGRIDGLPGLPVAFLERRTATDVDPAPTVRNSVIDQKLQRAFGPGCAETAYNHRIELQKNGVILATNAVMIEPDGRCKLKPFSVAVSKDRPGQDPEVYTVHADEAYIVFDRPVKNLAEMGQRKIVGCDLNSDPSLLTPDPRRHRITCHHNRGTADPDDDLVMETVGPVSYRETPEPAPANAPPQIQTTSAIRMIDKRGAPKSTTITALGMKIYLTGGKDTAASKPAPKAGVKTGTATGVKQVVLPEQVTMDLWMDPGNGFLATGAKPAASAERSNVQITTPGAFKYTIGEDADVARFEMKPPAKPGEQPGFVQVIRPLIKDGATVYDRLDSDFLELSFAHKPATPTPPGPQAGKEPSANLQWIHAWGQYVIVTSQGENLQAHGSDLYHDAASKQTTLKGTPEVVAIKDGNEIHAPALVLLAADGKAGAEAYALGAGWFKGQPGTGTDARPLTARWQDRMHYRKDGDVELLTLAGAAVFEDPERKQTLSGEQIKLTLAPDPNAKTATGGAKVKPRRLEVTGRVAARAPELKVQDTDQLVVLFNDAPPKVPHGDPTPTGTPVPGVTPIPGPTISAPNPKAGPPAEKPPLVLSARSVTASLLAHSNGPTDLDTVHCEGQVRVHQDPATAQDKPIDMKGDALDLKRKALGHELIVSGDPDRPAEVSFPDLALAGPSVKIDQVENVAEVIGPGAMRLQSTTDFQGNKLAKSSELLVTWRQEMHFNGTIATFQGQVQADQENTRLLCHSMQVTLDQTVKFAQQAGGNKQTANVKKVVCNTTGQDGAAPVSVVDSLRENGAVTRYQRIEARELTVLKADGQLEAPGPGEVRILQKGAKNMQASLPGPGQPKAAPAADLGEELKLTYVRYDHKLFVYNDKRLAIFWGNAEVLHLPADDPALHLNINELINRLPPRALYLKCEKLEVFSMDKGPKKSHVLKAIGKATVQFDNFYGLADSIVYDEEKQQVTFIGSPGRPAVLNETRGQGQPPKKTSGEKFTYNRATGQFDGTNVNSISQ
jgi:lipopolysaccharide export system protein LptA